MRADLLLPAVLILTMGQLSSCLGDAAEGNATGGGAVGDPATIRIRISAEPQGLNPLLSTRGEDRYVEDQIFQTLNELDPETFALVPCLASVPERTELSGNRLAYDYLIDSAAAWPDGSPVTAQDVIFSLKAMLNPLVAAGAYRPYYQMVADVETDAADPRRFRVITSRPYLLTERSLGDLYIYPEYVYDPDGLLRDIPIDRLIETEQADLLVSNSPALRRFAERFTDPTYSYEPDKVIGSGPYRLVRWDEGRQLRLERREDYWASDRNESWLRAGPRALVFSIIVDDATVGNALRGGSIDVVLDMPMDQFRRLRDDDYLQRLYNFEVVPGFDYYAVLFNQDDPLLRDVDTRRALAHLVDVDLIIKRLLGGLGERVTGPVLPSKPYYNDSLEPISYDPRRAAALLEQAGWRDSDDNGILDKIIDGRSQELSFPLLSFATATSDALALSFAENARSIGVDIEVVRQEPRILYSTLQAGDFTASMVGQRYLPGPDDFTQVWSSTSVPPAGSNRSSFRSTEADSLLRRIATTLDPADRQPLYRRFQEIIYGNQPMIFLYSPYDRLIVSDRLEYEVTSLAPNVYVNALEFVEEPIR